MGFLGNFGKAFGFIDNTAGQDGANAVQAANTSAVNRINDSFDTTSKNLQPIIDTGNTARAGVVQGSTAGGLDARLREIFDSEIFQALNEERGRAVSGQLSATGQSRSGLGLQEAAKVPTELGLIIEQALTGRLQGLSDQGLNTQLGVENLRGGNANSIANLLSGIGKAEAQGFNIDNTADTQGIHKFSDQQKEILQTSLSSAGKFFSDPRLKENIRHIGFFKGLKVYTWDWIKGVKDTIVSSFPTVGFMSDEVREKYPQYVSEFGGFDVIDYPKLINKLEGA